MKNTTATLYDTLGKTISTSVQSKENELVVLFDTALAQGIYILSLSNSNYSQTIKIPIH